MFKIDDVTVEKVFTVTFEYEGKSYFIFTFGTSFINIIYCL